MIEIIVTNSTDFEKFFDNLKASCMRELAAGRPVKLTAELQSKPLQSDFGQIEDYLVTAIRYTIFHGVWEEEPDTPKLVTPASPV